MSKKKTSEVRPEGFVREENVHKFVTLIDPETFEVFTSKDAVPQGRIDQESVTDYKKHFGDGGDDRVQVVDAGTATGEEWT